MQACNRRCKERIEAELDIARRIQASNLPTKAIENDYFIVDGYSHPAKEVGGDFFDYYNLDEAMRNALYDAYCSTKNTIKLDVSNVEINRKKLAIQFQRKLTELSDEDLQSMFNILEKEK